ncbi:MAG: hypothetical protein J0H99_22225, partial [Rhodospirillales bacterium]|nr:hypothetical protein [Rhodospirillales bacterium]
IADGRHRPVPARAVHAGRVREAEAVRGLHARHALHRPGRVRRLQGRLPRHGDLPHGPRTRRAGRRARGRGAAGGGGRAHHRPEADCPEQGHKAAEAAELLAERVLRQLVGAAHQQQGLPPGGDGTNYYTEAGKELLNQHDAAKAKKLLAESGYKGEKVVLLTNKDYPSLYNTALVMAQELKAIGINAELQVLDWPTALQKSMKGTPDWNYFFTGWITYVAVGGMQTLRPMAEPNPVYTPPDNKTDPAFMAAFEQVANGATLEIRQQGFARAQQIALEDAMVVPMGVMPKVQGVRSGVEHFEPFYNPRLYNVWLKN